MPSSDNGKPPREWLEEMFARLETPLVSYVKRQIGGDLETARDIVQEAFVRLCQESWPKIGGHATAWLYRTCRNQAIDIIRREGRMRAVHGNTDVATVEDRTSIGPSENLSDGEQVDQLKLQIKGLPAQQQEVLRLRMHDGLSYKQISEVTGLSTSNVGYHLHQAILRLRETLKHQV